jgi:glycosyltransferase involved in cell wall biosynthesis
MNHAGKQSSYEDTVLFGHVVELQERAGRGPRRGVVREPRLNASKPVQEASLFGYREASRPTSVEPHLELTILMPCLNEVRTLAACIGKARGFLARTGITGEVLVADNGSTDGSQELARSHGARVIDVLEKGYGSALIAGARAARGRYVIMGDSDDSYDFSQLDLFVERLREGHQLVMGNRFAGGIQDGAMPPLHRYLGNPVLTTIGRILYLSPCRDFHCGLRGFERDAILELNLRATGMEFASEMVAKASVWKLRIAEVPTTLAPDGRDRAPHLRSWRDGWRHLRLLLLFSPRSLFLYPGAALFGLGALAMLRLLVGPVLLGPIGLGVHTLLYASAAVILGYQAVIFWICAKVYSRHEGIVPPDPAFERLSRHVHLERVLLASLALFVAGLMLALSSVVDWGSTGFRALDAEHSMRLVVPATTAMLLAAQSAYGACFVALMNISRSRHE